MLTKRQNYTYQHVILIGCRTLCRAKNVCKCQYQEKSASLICVFEQGLILRGLAICTEGNGSSKALLTVTESCADSQQLVSKRSRNCPEKATLQIRTTAASPLTNCASDPLLVCRPSGYSLHMLRTSVDLPSTNCSSVNPSGPPPCWHMHLAQPPRIPEERKHSDWLSLRGWEGPGRRGQFLPGTGTSLRSETASARRNAGCQQGAW